VEAYTPSTNSWSTLKAMTTARFGHWAVVVGTSASNFAIYALGGDLAAGLGVTSSVEKYDPASNTWTAAPSMPRGLANLWATTATDAGGGTSIYTHGGMDSTGTSGGNQYAFSPSSQQWTTPAAAQGMQTTATAAWVGINDTIYMPYGTTYAYKPATNTWSTLAGMMTRRDWPAAVVGKNGHIYVFGGDSGGHLSSAETYAPELDKWANIASMPTALVAPVAATGTDGRIYVFSAASATASSLIFTP
jgi:N-acetylneuraminic acid mutarotase